MAKKNKPQSFSKRKNLELMTAKSHVQDVMKALAAEGITKSGQKPNTPSFKKLLKESFKNKNTPDE